MDGVSRYANGHLFSMYRAPTLLETDLQRALGDLSEEDFTRLERYH